MTSSDTESSAPGKCHESCSCMRTFDDTSEGCGNTSFRGTWSSGCQMFRSEAGQILLQWQFGSFDFRAPGLSFVPMLFHAGTRRAWAALQHCSGDWFLNVSTLWDTLTSFGDVPYRTAPCPSSFWSPFLLGSCLLPTTEQRSWYLHSVTVPSPPCGVAVLNEKLLTA